MAAKKETAAAAPAVSDKKNAVSAGLPDMLRRIPNTEPYGIYPVFLNEIQRIHNSSVKVLHLYSGIFQLRYKR